MILKKWTNMILRLAAFTLLTAAPFPLLVGAMFGDPIRGFRFLLGMLALVSAGFLLATPFILALRVLKRRGLLYFLSVGTVIGAVVGSSFAYLVRDFPGFLFGSTAMWFFAAVGATNGFWGGGAWFLVFESRGSLSADRTREVES
ncbi:hypothetical protein G7076_10685 [Sphingomonas sp. HDW15A]|uniref:hypothetical protein n=1 Tax=Sphingomonas sp. HDW15A TaxID=2714942 RepID=UPI001409C75B|nr:hypothetical protein [Sphingomonas sp. HDW15A]QIK96830.1 hypothetical protein G7076_10685 [Sphingomonas sp. HDW15A]